MDDLTKVLLVVVTLLAAAWLFIILSGGCPSCALNL